MMKRLFGDNSFCKALLLLAALSMGAVALAGEKREQTYVKSNFRTANKTVIAVGAGREIVQELSIADIKFSNPDFRVKEEWTYIHTDLLNGAGTDRGYYIDTHEDGSQTFGVFEGTKKVTSNPDGTWEATWEGTYKYLGGTGKFQNLKGGGKYKGGASSANLGGRENGQETIEY